MIKLRILPIIVLLALIILSAIIFKKSYKASAVCVPFALPTRVSNGLGIIPLSIDDTSLTLVWSKPSGYSSIADYNIYKNGVKIGDSNNNKASPAQIFKDTFYKDAANNSQVKISEHNYMVTGLTPSTSYTFTIKGVDTAGHEIDEGAKYTVKTATLAAPTIIDVTKSPYNAVGDGVTDNTNAIQNAINDCPSGGRVVIPTGTFISSCLTIDKSNFTLKIDGTLLRAANSAKLKSKTSYPFIYLHGSSLKQIRIVGTGTINENGWKYKASANPADIEYNPKGILTESEKSGIDTISSISGAFGGQENGRLAKLEFDLAKTSPNATDTTAYDARSFLLYGESIDGLYLGNGLTLTNPCKYTTHISNVTNYTVNGLIVQSFNSNNGDCLNVTKFSGFTVLNSVINSGDDDIAMNAGKAGDSAYGNAWIFDNYIARGHGGVSFGSATSSWIENVLAEDNIMVQTSNGLRVKSKPYASGGVRFVTFRDTAMKDLTNIVDGKIDDLTVGYQMDGCPFIFTTNYPLTPSGLAQSVTTAQNTPMTGRLQAEQPDGATLKYNIYSRPSNGTVDVHSDGTFLYTPNQGFTGSDMFTFTASNGFLTGSVTTEKVAVSAATSDATQPNALPDVKYTMINHTAKLTNKITGKLMATAPAGSFLTYAVVPGKNVKDGTLALNADGSYTYTPMKGFSGVDSFTYTATNGSSVSNSAVITFVVNNSWPIYHDFDIENCSVIGATTSGIINDGNSTFKNYKINFKNVAFKSVHPALLINLKNSSFDNVTFKNLIPSNTQSAWQLKQSSGLTFNSKRQNSSTK